MYGASGAAIVAQRQEFVGFVDVVDLTMLMRKTLHVDAVTVPDTGFLAGLGVRCPAARPHPRRPPPPPRPASAHSRGLCRPRSGGWVATTAGERRTR